MTRATVETAAAAVVAVEARDRVGSSGFFIRAHTILTADHAIESDDIEVVMPTAARKPRARRA